MNTVKLLSTIAGAATAIVLAMSSAQALPFQNGSFETRNGVTPGAIGGAQAPQYQRLLPGDISVDGWTVGGAGVDYMGTYWQHDDGVRSLDLNALATGSISQSFDTILGQQYRVTFALAGNPQGDPNIKAGIAAAGTGIDSFVFDTTSTSQGAMGWVDNSFDFFALGTSTALSFTSTIAGQFGPALDNVRVAAVVPEPATLGLMGFGLVAAGWAFRRRRKATR